MYYLIMKKDKELKNIIVEARKTKGTTPYSVAESLGITIGELLDKIEDDKLEKEWNTYLNGYKDYLLRVGLMDKMSNLYVPLLEEAGVLNAENMGNDLELFIDVGNTEVKVDVIKNTEGEDNEEKA